MKDILSRKRKYDPLEISFDDNLDEMFERGWGFGKCAVAGVVALGVVGLLIVVGQAVIGLD